MTPYLELKRFLADFPDAKIDDWIRENSVDDPRETWEKFHEKATRPKADNKKLMARRLANKRYHEKRKARLFELTNIRD